MTKTLTLLLLFASFGWAEEKTKEPTLTPEQRLALRDVQVPMLNANRDFSEFMLRIQKQLESMPEYQKLKAATDSANAKYNQARHDVLTKACADCEIDQDTLALKRTQIAKAETKTTEKK